MSNSSSAEVPSVQGRPAWVPKPHVLAILLGTAIVAIVTFYVVRQNYDTKLDFWKSELRGSVRYQTWTLQNSLQQSQDDSQVLADFAATRKLLQTQVGAVSTLASRAALQTQVLSIFEEYRNIYEYGALYLFDDQGRIAIQATDASPWNTVITAAEFKNAFNSVLLSRRYAVALERGFDQQLTLLFMMPVFPGGVADRSQTATHSPIGVVVIADLFARDLLPLLAAKRVLTRTGETVLLQLHGEDGRYVSPRRYATDSDSHTLASDSLRRAASTAVETGTVLGEFVDYRGVGVLAAMTKIQSINSTLVSKVDRDEALSDFRRDVQIEIVTAASIFIAYVGLVLMYNRRTVAREMREGLARQHFVNQMLETTVAQRTSELAQTNQQLHQELSERLKAEEEVRSLNAELDQRVHDRTAELESANKELEAFSYSVSHDLRAPLRAVNGFAGIVLEDFSSQLPEEGKEYLERIRNRGTQMGRLIDDLLAFSRLSRQAINGRRVDMGALVRSALEELNPQYEGRQLDTRIGSLPPCYGDPALLKQVWLNLLSNAIKYSRERTPAVIEIGCQRENGEDIYWVRDNGAGFDMAYRDKLFGVFQRLHRDESFEGTGVGLAIVQRVVNRHGGRVWAESEQGRGATFRFSLERDHAA